MFSLYFQLVSNETTEMKSLQKVVQTFFEILESVDNQIVILYNQDRNKFTHFIATVYNMIDAKLMPMFHFFKVS